MQLAVMSDIHGNLPALEAVLADVKQHNVDGIIVAGDLTGGPQQVVAIDLLHALGSWMIRGNGDSRLLEYDRGRLPRACYISRAFACLRWDYHHLDRKMLDFIRALPEQRVVKLDGTAPIRVVHGSPRNPSEKLCPHSAPAELDLALAQISEPVLICGHTHIPWVVERNGKLALNPGAVCGPLDGQVGAQYALLDWEGHRWRVEHRTIPYNLGKVRAAFAASGLLQEGGAFARTILLAIQTGRNIPEEFLAYAHGLAARAGLKNYDVVPDDIWEQARATFNWHAWESKSLESS